MFSIPKRRIAFLLLTAFFLTQMKPARADIAYTHDSKAIGVIVGVVAAGALIGFGIYYAVHRGHVIDGCAVSGSQGMQLRTQPDGRIYLLRGDVSSIRGGEKVRLSGTKKRQGGEWEFAVEKLRKDYGSCPVQSQRP